MKMVAVALAAVLGLSAGSAQAEVKGADLADMQCLALVAYLGGQAAEGTDEQAGLVGGMMYYLGRLEGRSPDTDWLAELGQFLITLEESDLQAVAPRCGMELQVKGQALISWGEAFQAGAE